MSHRKHIGFTYTSYPAKEVSLFLGDRLAKIIFGIVGCLVWIGVFFLLAVIYNFLNNNLLMAKPQTTVEEIVRSEIGLWILLVGNFIAYILAYRSKSRRTK